MLTPRTLVKRKTDHLCSDHQVGTRSYLLVLEVAKSKRSYFIRVGVHFSRLEQTLFLTSFSHFVSLLNEERRVTTFDHNEDPIQLSNKHLSWSRTKHALVLGIISSGTRSGDGIFQLCMSSYRINMSTL